MYELFTAAKANAVWDRITSVNSSANTNKDLTWSRMFNQQPLDGMREWMADHKEDVQVALQDTLEHGFPTPEDGIRDFITRQITLSSEQAGYESSMLKIRLVSDKLALTLCRLRQCFAALAFYRCLVVLAPSGAQ